MPAKKVRVDVFDGTGNRYTVTFEGQVTREKAVRLLDIVELLGGMPSVDLSFKDSNTSKFDCLQLIIEKYFPIVWFSSRDVQSVFASEMKESINLSTVSTYLARMVDRGTLAKSGTPNRRRYRITTRISEMTLNSIGK